MNINTIYLLTGAAGFLGINICTQLIERGEHIRAFVLKGDPARKYLPAEVEVLRAICAVPRIAKPSSTSPRAARASASTVPAWSPSTRVTARS